MADGGLQVSKLPEKVIDTAKYTKQVTFNIEWVDAQGNEIAPGSSITITMPIPKADNGAEINKDKLVILHFHDNGTCETLEKGKGYTLNADGTVTFTVEHFSTFVFAEATNNDSDEDETVEGANVTVASPKTGDMTASHLAVSATWLMLMAVAIMTTVFFLSRREEEK